MSIIGGARKQSAADRASQRRLKHDLLDLVLHNILCNMAELPPTPIKHEAHLTCALSITPSQCDTSWHTAVYSRRLNLVLLSTGVPDIKPSHVKFKDKVTIMAVLCQ